MRGNGLSNVGKLLKSSWADHWRLNHVNYIG